MAVGEDYDVVVVGFGAAGASAAMEAARSGARVLVVDRGSHLRMDRAAWAAVLAAGIEVRGQTSVQELEVEAGRVIGVGCEGLDPFTPAGLRLWWMERCARWTGHLSPWLADVVRRRAEVTWQERATLSSVRCRAVVLAVPRSSWDVVGPAVWSATAARTATPPGRHLAVVSDTGVTAELAVRTWCAQQAGQLADPGHGELEVDPFSGAVRVGRGHLVPGLYAVEVGHVPVAGGRHLHRAQEAARRAGRSAAGARRAEVQALRSVG